MDGPRIRDIATIAKMRQDLAMFGRLRRMWPLAKPLMSVLGVDTAKVSEALGGIERLSREFHELSGIPDRFNDLFAERGWIIHDAMNLDVVKDAIGVAQGGDPDRAEQLLVGYYGPETVEWLLRRMRGIDAFKPCMRLAELALEDYRQKRFHACTPVVLALLDGMVSELHPQRRGFFAEGTDLGAWDSMAAHDRGLNALAGLLNKGRRKTTTEALRIPYRHGIVHGRDLGYDNELVAAKSWAALFAAGDWAVRAERGELQAPEEKPQPTWGDILAQLRRNEEAKTLLEKWRPRNLGIGHDVPESGPPEAYAEGTPERRLAEYLAWWTRGNYGRMEECAARSFLAPAGPAEVREVFRDRRLERFALRSITDQGAALTVIVVHLVFRHNDELVELEHEFRVLAIDPDGEPALAGQPGASWTILTWRVP